MPFDHEPELFQAPWIRRLKRALAAVGFVLFIALVISGFYIWFAFEKLFNR